ncbi:MAG: histidinol dehydrogenase [Alphaproteobacteria bacterium]|nr:histidinol dehydrogenase [Alphaproteobacteria bacterium]
MTKINQWVWSTLDKASREKIMRRSESNIDAAMDATRTIIEDVKTRGDDALRDYALKFDKARINGSLKASDAEFDAAYDQLEPEIIEAIKYCAENVKIHHQQQMERVEKFWLDEVRPGIFAGEKTTAVDSAGLYVPRGKGAYPSVMYMLCTPAVQAGVKNIAVCTPPTPEGGIDAASLVAADICGVRNVYKVGGGQAIAALAYGTQTVPKVDIVAGPGSAYVAAAKRILGNVINPGMPAGPSDSAVFADASAHPENTAWDLINEAEHGPDSCALLITTDAAFAKKVAEILPRLIASLPEPRKTFCETVFSNYGGIMLCRDQAEAVDVANMYAAEHLLLKVEKPEILLPQLKHAGEILIGEASPMVMGNFGIGVNAVLPTSQQARTHSCTSVWSFLKRTSLAYVTAKGFDDLQGPVTRLAHYEGFTGHARVIENRDKSAFKDIDVSKLKG